MSFPQKAEYIIIGAGIHGLSTALHLAQKLKSQGKGDGSKILIIEKGSIASGASGIACGGNHSRLDHKGPKIPL